MEYGLVDRLIDMRAFLRERYGDKVVTPLITEGRSLFGWRKPGVGQVLTGAGTVGAAAADGLRPRRRAHLRDREPELLVALRALIGLASAGTVPARRTVMNMLPIPPVIAWTVGAIGAVVMSKLLARQWRRVNEELDAARTCREGACRGARNAAA